MRSKASASCVGGVEGASLRLAALLRLPLLLRALDAPLRGWPLESAFEAEGLDCGSESVELESLLAPALLGVAVLGFVESRSEDGLRCGLPPLEAGEDETPFSDEPSAVSLAFAWPSSVEPFPLWEGDEEPLPELDLP